MNTSLLPAEKDPMGAVIAKKQTDYAYFLLSSMKTKYPSNNFSAKPDKCLYSNAQPSQWLPEQYST